MIDKDKDKPLNSSDIELAVAKFFNWRMNLIVPNVFWGLGFLHELDVMVVTKAHYAYEIEIKVSLSDLKADLKKWHGHFNDRIRKLFFAIPKIMLEKSIEFIPQRAGILSVSQGLFVETVRPPKINKNAKPLDDKTISKLYQLAAMRTWALKTKLQEIRKRKQKYDAEIVPAL